MGEKSFNKLGDDGERIGVKAFPIEKVSSTMVIVDGRRPCRFKCGGLEVEEPERRDKEESPISLSSSMTDDGGCSHTTKSDTDSSQCLWMMVAGSWILAGWRMDCRRWRRRRRQ